MAISLKLDVAEALSLNEYVARVKDSVDPCDLDSLLASAPDLRALGNNRTFLADMVNAGLKEYRDFQSDNPHGPQSLILARVGNLAVRANIWLPAQTNDRIQKIEDDVFSYLAAHDHNFDFLTIGYFGPGYETTIYEYDPIEVVGYVGEAVDMRFSETTTLDEGKIICFRAGRDIHTQLHPPALSISINLLASCPEKLQRDQYYFDTDQKVITRFVDNQLSARVTVVQLAAHIGNADTCDILTTLSHKHPSPRTRAEAYAALEKLRPEQAESLWLRAGADAHLHVRHAAAGRLRLLQQQSQSEIRHAQAPA